MVWKWCTCRNASAGGLITVKYKSMQVRGRCEKARWGQVMLRLQGGYKVGKIGGEYKGEVLGKVGT
eukprot:15357006-Ditylum_brightwellii.AAC.1